MESLIVSTAESRAAADAVTAARTHAIRLAHETAAYVAPKVTPEQERIWAAVVAIGSE